MKASCDTERFSNTHHYTGFTYINYVHNLGKTPPDHMKYLPKPLSISIKPTPFTLGFRGINELRNNPEVGDDRRCP